MAKNLVPDNPDFMTCPTCQHLVQTELHELKRNELVEYIRSREAAQANASLAKKIQHYRGPHTKTTYVVDNLKKWDAWSAQHPDEPPLKT
jgi:hypothetical protein